MTVNEYTEELPSIVQKYTVLRQTCSEFIVGNEQLIEAVLIGVLSQGHVLIEGIPGTAKTSVIKIIGHLLGCETKRVQCTVDLQPSDIIGVRIWNYETKEFELKKGPAFTNMLHVDEINRLPPRSQSALIEAMSERQVTIDGITLPLEKPYFTVATQNPFEQEGVFPLIEAQIDRFMFCVRTMFLSEDEEKELIKREQGGFLDVDKFCATTKPIFTPEEVLKAQECIQKITVSDPVQNYIGDIIVASRKHGDVRLGISSRGSISLLRGAKAFAALNGRDYVKPDDVKHLARITLSHRLVLNYEAEISGSDTNTIVDQILDTVVVP